MPDTLQRASGTVTSSQSTVYTAPAATRLVVRHIAFINTSATDVTAQLWVHGVQYVPGIVVPALSSRAMDVSMILVKATETIQVQASATVTTLTCVVHGVEET